MCDHCQFHSLTSGEFPLPVRKSGRKHQARGTSLSFVDETELPNASPGGHHRTPTPFW